MKRLLLALILPLLVVGAPQVHAACGAGTATTTALGSQCIVLLTATSTSVATFNVPSDWTSVNSIECIGAGGDGFTPNSQNGPGGGGGAYAKISNLYLARFSSVSYFVGIHATSTTAGGIKLNETYFNGAASSTASLSCAFGKPSITNSATSTGGSTANSTGTTLFAGGDGAQAWSLTTRSGNGGGGSAGPTGAGKYGGGIVSNGGGGGGGGSDGGSSTIGNANSGNNGGAGGNGLNGTGAGAGGTAGVDGGAGTLGGGGGAGFTDNTSPTLGGAGGCDSAWDATYGACGGGGGGGGNSTAGQTGKKGGNGGTYGAGGGGGGRSATGSAPGGVGGQGLIVIIYTPAGTSKYTFQGGYFGVSGGYCALK